MRGIKTHYFLIVALWGAWPVGAIAQRYAATLSPFKLGLVFGFNLAQIDGDKFSGYDQFGFSGGLHAAAVFSPRFQLVIEMLYNQTGSKTDGRNVPPARRLPIRPIDIRFNFVEVPVLAALKVHQVDGDLFRFDLRGGLSYGRLLSTKIEEIVFFREDEIVFGDMAPDFKRNQLALVVDGKWNLSSQLGLCLRHTVALSKLYANEDPTPKQVPYLRSYFLSIQAAYIF
jgi:hypothetical protein